MSDKFCNEHLMYALHRYRLVVNNYTCILEVGTLAGSWRAYLYVCMYMCIQ